MKNRFGPGSTFGGSNGKRFIVEAQAGRGGQAEVFRCLDTRLHRTVALKVCTAPAGPDRRLFLDRFEHELRLTTRVQHPHVLQVYDCGELADGQPWVLLEWMQHGSLADLVKRERDTGYYLPLAYVHYYATAMAAALRASHGAEIVHRDVKPDNMLVGQDGVAKITDFGIAKDLTAEAPQLTAMGQTLGTLGFMANEQLKGLPGPQSDIFSWGISVYALLLGRMPKQQIVNSIPMGIMEDGAFDDAPAPFQEVLSKATALELNDRYASFTELLADLGRVDLTAPDTRPLFGTEFLPVLPSNAFVSGFTTAGGGPAPAIRGDGTVPSHPPITPDTTDGRDRPIPDTVSLDVAGRDLDAEIRLASGADSEPGPTRAQSFVGLSNAPPPPGQATPRKRKRKRKSPAVGPTRLTHPTSPERPGKAAKGALVAVAVVLALAVGAMVWLWGGVPEPDPSAEQVAASAYAAAILQGDAAAAASAAQVLPASSADRASGKLVRAWDALLAGQAEQAREASVPLLSEPMPVGAEASLITAASHRLGGAEGYASALEHYRTAASCDQCGPVATHARRGLEQACFVLGESEVGCADVLGSLGERDQLLAAASVLRADGHSDAAGQHLSRALATSAAPPSCLESAVLKEFEVPLGVAGDDLVAARNLAARSAADCGGGG